ncbi:tyrosine-type recombinase/integrase [Pseudomonas sp. ATCC 13867]|uniref:tyrosine-type recombinase/integrase n=1 Tax=Pseudomonas sp. ATCC 13867 TaxID=1294143 RepID=UPI0012FF1F70|nr:site-specific integrase [Pseudomonas sp. ATCC 13867]
MKNLAANTIANALRALQLFVTFLESEGIDLRKRLSDGLVLKLYEVEALAQACRRPLEALSAVAEVAPAAASRRAQNMRLERFRSRLSGSVEDAVNPAVTATRLQCIRDYVGWMAEIHLAQQAATPQSRGELRAAVDAFRHALDARMPSGGASQEREGVPPEIRSRLLEVTRPDAPQNPWVDDFARCRNALIVDWLYYLGLRRGELLSLRVSDIDFRRCVVHVFRRPDALDDPRRSQPVVKTRARELPLSQVLLDATRNYIVELRSSRPQARKHEFLFVAASGAPLSMPAFAKVFTVLRSKIPDLPDDLTPHTLRHTWNDRFSEEMDHNKVSEDTERKARSYLMGWSETSGTAVVYTRRHVREKAKQVSLDLQESMRGGKCDEQRLGAFGPRNGAES